MKMVWEVLEERGYNKKKEKSEQYMTSCVIFYPTEMKTDESGKESCIFFLRERV